MLMAQIFSKKTGDAEVGLPGDHQGAMEDHCQLSDLEFSKFSRLIYDVAGINLQPVKKTMLDGRLRRRLRAVGVSSFAEYFKYLQTPEGQEREMVLMLDAVSTNKTDFFREAKHFDLLTGQVLPALMRKNRQIRIWSAGCSTGEEPYTLAMVMEEFCESHKNLGYSILATDLSTDVLAKARLAIYEDSKIEPVPTTYRYKYLLRGEGSRRGYHRVAPRLRRKVNFQRLNFMDEHFAINTEMDIIFCRNVIIYFDQQTQAALFEKFYRQLAPGGYLFIGHSESLHEIDGKMRRLGPTVFQKK